MPEILGIVHILVPYTCRAMGPSPARPGPQPAGRAGLGPSVNWPGRAWAGPGLNKNINTKPRFFILILIKTDYKLYFRLKNV